MLPACRTDEATYTIPTFDIVPGDVEGFMDELWEFPDSTEFSGKNPSP